MQEKNVEKYILNKIKNYPHELVNNTVKDLSKIWFVGQTSILRVVKELKFKSYKELQRNCYLKIKLDEMTNVVPENNVTSDIECINNVFKKSLHSIISTKEFLDINNLIKFAQTIQNASKIIFFGVGNSFSIANMLSISLFKIGYNSHCFQSTKELLISLQYLEHLEDIVFVFFSNSGETREVVYLAKEVHSKGGKFALITSSISKYHTNSLKYALYTFKYNLNHNEQSVFPLVSQQFCQIIFNNLLLNLIILNSNRLEKINLVNKSIETWNKS